MSGHEHQHAPHGGHDEKHGHVHGEACAHGHAPVEAMAMAEARCQALKLRLTPIRREVLGHLAASARPLGAYDLIQAMATGSDRRPAPITVYRALDFLMEAGLVHRIESRNAYMACAHGHKSDDMVAFLICDACGCVTEAGSEALKQDLDRLASESGFRPSARVIEVFGRCAHCA